MPKFNPSAILKQIRNKKDNTSSNNSNKNSDSEREQYEYTPSHFNSNTTNNDNFSYSPQTQTQTQTTTERMFRTATPPPTFFVQNSEYLSSRLNNEKYEPVHNAKTENHTPTFTQTSTSTSTQSQTPIPNLSFLNTTYTPPEPLYQMPSHNNPLPNPYSVVDLLKDQLEEKISENRHLSNLVVEAELDIKNLQDQKIALEGALRDAMLQIQSLDQRCRGLAEQRNDLLKELGNRGRDSLEKRLAEVERRVSPTPPPNYEKLTNRPISPPLRRIPSNRASSSMSYPPNNNNNNDNHHNVYNNHDNNNNINNNSINSFHPPLTVPDFDKRKPAFVSTISPHSTRFQHKQEMGVIHLPKGIKESEKPVIRIDLASEIKSMYHNNSNNNNNNSNYTNQNSASPHFENGRGRPPSRTKQRPIK